MGWHEHLWGCQWHNKGDKDKCRRHGHYYEGDRDKIWGWQGHCRRVTGTLYEGDGHCRKVTKTRYEGEKDTSKMTRKRYEVGWLVLWAQSTTKGLYQGWGRLSQRDIAERTIKAERRTEWESRELSGEFMEWNIVEKVIRIGTDTRTIYTIVFEKEWASLVVRDINRNIPTMWRWARGNARIRETNQYMNKQRKKERGGVHAWIVKCIHWTNCPPYPARRRWWTRWTRCLESCGSEGSSVWWKPPSSPDPRQDNPPSFQTDATASKWTRRLNFKQRPSPKRATLV